MFLLPRLREVRNVRHISIPDVIFRVTRINALAGVVFEIIGSRSRNGSDDNSTPTRRTDGDGQ